MGLLCWKEWVESWRSRTSASLEDGQEWVNDGSVDFKGRPVIRSTSGGWKASLFIIGVEFSERLTYYGIASNLIIYLTTVLHEETARAAKDVNNWAGVTTVMPLLGGFMADAYTGRYWMVLISSVIYLLGLILLTLSVSLSSLKPPGCPKTNVTCLSMNKPTSTQRSVFFLALYLISIGTGGHKPSLQSFGADQFDEEDKTEKLKKASFFNWWYCGLCGGVLLAVTVVVYVQDYESWGIGFGIPTVAMAISIPIFIYGTPLYRHQVPGGSPITRIAQVFVAAMLNRNKSLPSDTGMFHENWDMEARKPRQRLLSRTDNFKWLDKAAIAVEANANADNISGRRSIRTQNPSPWRVCTVTQVEETKLILRMVPIWLCCLIFGMCISQGTTFFVKQGVSMDRRLGSHFEIPPASLLTFSAGSMILFVAIYDRFLVPVAKKVTGRERGITLLQRIGIGMFISILFMVSAALVETRRVDMAKKYHGVVGAPVRLPISVFWLVPQFVLLGIADVFTLVGLQEYFYDQGPDGMRSLGIAFYLSVVGVGNFLSTFLITIVEKVTELRGHESWFTTNPKGLHWDYFYWLLAVLGALNLCVYLYAARSYTYKKVKPVEESIDAKT
eukprot:PITA_09956